VSKDSDCSLVSNTIFSEILPSLLTSLTKNQHSPTKKFFSSANYKICRVFWAFDQVGSAYQTREIPVQSHVRSSCFYTNLINPGESVNMHCNVAYSSHNANKANSLPALNHGNTCLMNAKCSEYYALLDAVRGLHIIRNNWEFVLIKHRRSSILGFWTLRV